MSPPAESPPQKARDRATVIPLFGLFLLCSPVLNLFADQGRLFGLPVAYFYIFFVWAFLILITRRLTRSIVGPAGAHR